MLQIELLLQTVNQNLLLGFIPEPVGLLLFGVSLVILTLSLRWILNRVEAQKIEPKPKKAN